MTRELPASLAPYLPKGHRLFYAEKQGALRFDWLLCICGIGRKLEKVAGPLVNGQSTVETEPVTEERWLEAINGCRVAMQLAPVTLDGAELPVREAPPLTPPPVVVPTAEEPLKRKVGRPKKESVHA